MNKHGAEIVKSVYLNVLNSSILLISIEVNANIIGQMKCRQISIDDLKHGKTQGTVIFSQFVLEYPDFIEFDDLNGVIVTKHDVEKVYRVWSMADLSLRYVLNHPDMGEFKIWYESPTFLVFRICLSCN